MNIAFPALFIFLLAFPGLIFRYTYARGFFRTRSPVSFRPITDEIGYSIVFAGIFHTLWCFLCIKFGIIYIDFHSAFILLIGAYTTKDGEYLPTVIESFSKYPFESVKYFIILYVFSALAGYFGHFSIRYLHLDWRFEAMRFRNEWWYLLKGEIMHFPEVQRELPEKISIDSKIETYVTAVVEQAKESYLYQGVLYDFCFDSIGNLDRIFLVRAQRRKLADDRPADQAHTVKGNPKFYPIEGKYFILRYSEVTTINLEYYIWKKTSPRPPTA